MAFCNRVGHSDGVEVALPGRKGTHKGCLYKQSSLCNGVEFVIGPIRFRQQLSFSTSSGVLSLRHQVERSGTASFAGHEAAGFADADRQICCRQQFSLFCSDYFSGQDGVLQQGRTFRWG